MPRGRKKATAEQPKPAKATVDTEVEPKEASLDVYYMIERLCGVQGWIYRTDGFYVVRGEQEENFRSFMVNAGFIPVKLPIRTSMSFMDAITNTKRKGMMNDGKV